jgi:hypothetical protein
MVGNSGSPSSKNDPLLPFGRLREPTQEALNYLDIFVLRVPLLRGARSFLFVRAEVGSVGEVMGKVSRICVASIPQ